MPPVLRHPDQRVVVWFSCGAASAVAAKIALDTFPNNTVIAYCDTGSEHPDNKRFLADVERWLGIEVVKLKSDKYEDIWDVFKKTRYLVGPAGARCTTELKKKLRFGFQLADDIQVFGYTTEEQSRAARFTAQNFDVILWTPLIEKGLAKAECLAAIQHVNIELPMMYKLGYKNNNCIGCVKGWAGYWNKIRVDFPDVFERMSKVERELGITILKVRGKQTYLDELEPGTGRYAAEEEGECSILCVDAMRERKAE